MDREKIAGRQNRRPHPRHAARQPVAIALQHEPGEIPTVTASGRGALAEKILEIAFANGIKVREDADLAQLLSAIELDCPIPVNCFEAVAEILNYLYRVNSGPAAVGGPAPADGEAAGEQTSGHGSGQ
jgi:flagellar biosynthesis protein